MLWKDFQMNLDPTIFKVFLYGSMIIESNSFLLARTPKISQIIKSTIQMLLEPWQVWCCDPFPGKPVPVTDHPLSEEPSPYVQSELPLAQLNAIFFLSCCWSLERGDAIFPSNVPLNQAEDCDEVTIHQPSFF